MIITKLLIEETNSGIVVDWADRCPSDMKVPVFLKKLVEDLIRLPDSVRIMTVSGTNYVIDRNDIESITAS